MTHNPRQTRGHSMVLRSSGRKSITTKNAPSIKSSTVYREQQQQRQLLSVINEVAEDKTLHEQLKELYEKQVAVYEQRMEEIAYLKQKMHQGCSKRKTQPDCMSVDNCQWDRGLLYGGTCRVQERYLNDLFAELENYAETQYEFPLLFPAGLQLSTYMEAFPELTQQQRVPEDVQYLALQRRILPEIAHESIDQVMLDIVARYNTAWFSSLPWIAEIAKQRNTHAFWTADAGTKLSVLYLFWSVHSATERIDPAQFTDLYKTLYTAIPFYLKLSTLRKIVREQVLELKRAREQPTARYRKPLLGRLVTYGLGAAALIFMLLQANTAYATELTTTTVAAAAMTPISLSTILSLPVDQITKPLHELQQYRDLFSIVSATPELFIDTAVAPLATQAVQNRFLNTLIARAAQAQQFGLTTEENVQLSSILSKVAPPAATIVSQMPIVSEQVAELYLLPGTIAKYSVQNSTEIDPRAIMTQLKSNIPTLSNPFSPLVFPETDVNTWFQIADANIEIGQQYFRPGLQSMRDFSGEGIETVVRATIGLGMRLDAISAYSYTLWKGGTQLNKDLAVATDSLFKQTGKVLRELRAQNGSTGDEHDRLSLIQNIHDALLVIDDTGRVDPAKWQSIFESRVATVIQKWAEFITRETNWNINTQWTSTALYLNALSDPQYSALSTDVFRRYYGSDLYLQLIGVTGVAKRDLEQNERILNGAAFMEFAPVLQATKMLVKAQNIQQLSLQVTDTYIDNFLYGVMDKFVLKGDQLKLLAQVKLGNLIPRLKKQVESQSLWLAVRADSDAQHGWWSSVAATWEYTLTSNINTLIPQGLAAGLLFLYFKTILTAVGSIPRTLLSTFRGAQAASAEQVTATVTRQLPVIDAAMNSIVTPTLSQCITTLNQLDAVYLPQLVSKLVAKYGTPVPKTKMLKSDNLAFILSNIADSPELCKDITEAKQTQDAAKINKKSRK